MSQLAGAPVRLQFMRWDEHGWDNYGPAQLADMRGAVDANGNIVAYEIHAVRDPGHLADGRRPDAAARRPPARTAGLGGPRHDQLGHAVRHPEPARDRQVAAADQQLLQDVDAAGAAGPADVLRLGAVDRRAGLRGEDGPVPVPAPEHLDDRPEPLARRRWWESAQLANWQPRVAELGQADRHGPQGPRDRARQLRRLAGRRRRRDRGEQEDRQDHGRRTRTPRRSPVSRSTWRARASRWRAT